MSNENLPAIIQHLLTKYHSIDQFLLLAKPQQRKALHLPTTHLAHLATNQIKRLQGQLSSQLMKKITDYQQMEGQQQDRQSAECQNEILIRKKQKKSTFNQSQLFQMYQSIDSCSNHSQDLLFPLH